MRKCGDGKNEAGRRNRVLDVEQSDWLFADSGRPARSNLMADSFEKDYCPLHPARVFWRLLLFSGQCRRN